ncbi:glycosyltransferase family 2 protein [Tamlana fucoidanivorans]|uniref:Glycosyltransferase family 2 protein n=1 Tax=Allotamlana fucoidanivorans TaxID=2583814 RepID=A0A5C4SQD5_9FLAO|nr:glycosyltransferase family 2 protein [Tamlana fucoidanivorans]TNJ45764.1 glycosyltransferase family 2 protein [Tamlana fucoidanivorans]
MSVNPKVTIVMATYNREHFILESLKSVQSQTFKNWECLIIDDGGNDNTDQIITPFLQKDTRFKFLKRPNNYLKGLPGCRNYGLDLAKGDYIVFFDDDDIVHPQNLELCVNELSIGSVSFCRYLRSVFFENFDYDFDFSKTYSSFYIDEKAIDDIVTNKLPFNSCAVMWKNTCFKELRFVETLMYAEEWELYSRIISNGFKGISINKVLFYGRKHPQSNTGEFWNNSPIRVNSKKEAIKLVVENLCQKELLSPYLFKYLVNLAISFRDFKLVKNVFKETVSSSRIEIFYSIKFFLFPLWQKVYRLKKKHLK